MKSIQVQLLGILSLLICYATNVSAEEKLSGTPIGTVRGFDYSTWQIVENIQHLAFDGDLNTCFATDARSYTWVGLDLGAPHIITKVGWGARQEDLGLTRVCLGIFEGANSPDFMDAVPIYIVKEKGEYGKIGYGNVSCSKGFRYVRWVSTPDARCNIAELEFYGTPGEGDESHMFQLTNIPTVCINTVDAQIPFDKETDIACNVIIIDGGKINVSNSAGVRERGNASRGFPKKPWRIKFDKKQQVLDSPTKAKKWTLINNYGDKTLLRNAIAFEIARRVGMDYVPFCRPVDVIMNGEYKGCYQLCDQIEVNSGRVDITEMTPDDLVDEALSGGYLIEIDAYADQEPTQSWFTTHKGLPITIKSPKDDEIQPVQKEYIQNYFQRLEDAIYASDYNLENADYLSMLDIDSFLQYFIVGELSGNTDTYWSTYMHKNRGDSKFITGPVWDFDLAFDNDSRTYPVTTTSKYSFLAFTWNSSAAGNMRQTVQRIVNDNKFNRERLARIWSLARDQHELRAENLNYFIDNLADEIDESQRLNFLRWPILFDRVHMNPVALGNYTSEVERVKSYLTTRLEQLDSWALMRYDPKYAILSGIDPVFSNLTINIVNGSISLPEDIEYKIFTPAGQIVFSGKGTSCVLTPGIYIVKTPNYNSAKVVVR